jgi:hypothetical protein
VDRPGAVIGPARAGCIMSVKIGDAVMSSDLTPMVAQFRPGACADGSGAWVVSACPPGLPLGGRLLGRNEVITAMLLAELIAVGKGDSPHAQGWRAELGLITGERHEAT